MYTELNFLESGSFETSRRRKHYAETCEDKDWTQYALSLRQWKKIQKVLQG